MNKKRTLLVVDDEPLIVEAICETLSFSNDLNIITANDGKESLEKVLTNTVDAVVSDINMPKMTGLQTLKELRQRGVDIPYIILTGYSDKKNTVEALRYGATDFLEKPFDDEDLIKTVENALELGVAQNALIAQLNQLVADGKLPPEDFDKVKKAKTALIGIRMNSKVKAS